MTDFGLIIVALALYLGLLNIANAIRAGYVEEDEPTTSEFTATYTKKV